MSDPYSHDVLKLAGDIPHIGRLTDPDGSAHKVSRICGSELTVDVNLDADHSIDEIGLVVKACALGQASASVLSRHAKGSKLDDVIEARDQLKAMLQDDGMPPQGRFSDLVALQGAAPYRQRHGSILLAFDATIAALSEAQS